MKCFLRYAHEYLEDSIPFNSISDAKFDFENTAKELDRYGQHIEASIHIAKDVESLNEYPEFVLTLTPRGAIRCDRA